jgi:hypothetical protein
MFIFWDGEETRDAGYCLFGASVNGREPVHDRLGAEVPATYLQGPYLRTAAMLDLLLSVAEQYPGASHSGFNFDYDVNQILRELSWRDLLTLKHRGKVTWHGYKIEHIPRKIFKVSDGSRHIRIDDCFSFFRCRYDKALAKWTIGNSQLLGEVSRGKDSRDDFWYRDIDFIRDYWSKEVQLGCHLMDRVKRTCHENGYKINQWHGPGALASYSLKSHGVPSLMSVRIRGKSPRGLPPGPPSMVIRSAYAGGWFERFKFGACSEPVYTWDINSAYVYALSLLPRLDTGRWVHESYTENDQDYARSRARTTRFAVFAYDWNAGIHGYLRGCYGVPFPLFHRETDGTIRRPIASSGWVWNPEAAELSAIPYAKFTEAWILEDDEEYPFDWVSEEFDKRLALQAAGDPGEKVLKWALASYYGRLAQRTGWNEKTKEAPAFHQLEWAGWITSKCRAMVYRAAIEAAKVGGLVSVDTDGIITTVPLSDSDLPNGIGNQLGRWKKEEFDGLVYLQNGVYWLKSVDCRKSNCDNFRGNSAECGHTWEEAKLRGIPQSKLHNVDAALESLRTGNPITFERRNFTGYRSALQHGRDRWLSWNTEPVSVNPFACGSRIHSKRLCRSCRKGHGFDTHLHDLALVMNRGSESAPHRLPWLEDTDESERLFREKLYAEEM